MITVIGEFLLDWTIRLIPRLWNAILDSLSKKVEVKLRNSVEKKVTEEIERVKRANSIVFGITGEPCPKSGPYRLRDDFGFAVIRTFREGDILPDYEEKLVT